MNTEEDSSRIDVLARLIEEGWRNDAAEELASRLTNRGGILSNRGRLKEGLADLEKAVELRPGSSIPREEFEKIVPHQACGSEIPRFEK